MRDSQKHSVDLHTYLYLATLAVGAASPGLCVVGSASRHIRDYGETAD